MDLHNNSIGLEIYKQNSGKDLQELYNLLIDKTAAGGLLIYDPVTKQTSKSSLSAGEVKKLKEIEVDKIEGKGQINSY